MKNILIIFGIIIILRCIYYLRRWLYLRKTYKIYTRHMKLYVENKDRKNNVKCATWLTENSNFIKKYILGANISDAAVPHIVPAGYGKGISTTISVLDNFMVKREDIASIFPSILIKARGYYKYQTLKSINPAEWLIGALFFPTYLMNKINIDRLGKIANILRILSYACYYFSISTIIYYRNNINIWTIFQKVYGR